MPLKGIKVLELATVVAAPIASRVLCTYGADVVKIESPAGDDMRRAGNSEGVVCEDDKNPLFSLANTGKKLVSVNLKTGGGMEAFTRLLSDADVFITNVRLAALKRLGIDYDSIRDRFPRLIYAHFSAYGEDGPEANKPGFDSTAFWLRSGPMADWPYGERPFTPTYAFGDVATSSAFVSGILMALLGRNTTGLGTYVTTSLYASGIWCNSVAVIAAQSKPCHCAGAKEEYLPADPLSDVYQCSDGIWIGVYDNEYVRDRDKFAKILELPELSDDPRYASLEDLRASGALKECWEKLKTVFLSNTAPYWQEYLSNANVACQIARRAGDVSKDAQAAENEYLSHVRFKGGLELMMPEPPIAFTAYGHRQCETASRLGKDTDEVLKNFGYSEEQLSELKADKAIV